MHVNLHEIARLTCFEYMNIAEILHGTVYHDETEKNDA
jgi:hypothetical protein